MLKLLYYINIIYQILFNIINIMKVILLCVELINVKLQWGCLNC